MHITCVPLSFSFKHLVHGLLHILVLGETVLLREFGDCKHHCSPISLATAE